MKLVIFGIGKISDAITSLIEDEGAIEIAGFTCDPEFKTKDRWHGRTVASFEEVEQVFPPATHRLLVAIGYQNLNRTRADRCAEARAKGYSLATWVSARASVPRTCTLGDNCVVMPGASLQPRAALGDDVLVWDNSVIGHHAVIGNDCYLAANCTISSSTVLGARSFVGVNAAIAQSIEIGEACFVGAGAIIGRNAESGGVYIRPDTERSRFDSTRFARIARLGN